jgi:hypothetical protein
MQGRRSLAAAVGFALLLVAATSLAQPPTITPTSNATNLVNAILGPGVALVPGTEVFVGGTIPPNLSAGTFTNGGLAPTGIGIQSGILLTTGKAADAIAPNDNGAVPEILGGGGPGDDTSTELGLAGDVDLTSLAGHPTLDATVLSFSFTTAFAGDLTFRFVFASEEYIDYVGTQFNDVFAFYLDGENLAVIPGEPPVPISVDTVNPLQNSGYYRNNINPAPIQVEYDGLTTVLTAQKLDLPAGTHTMKLAIADGSDYILDAAVFIEGGSFQITEVAVPVDVKPTSCPNPLNFNAKGVLPVAILGSESLDVRTIDPASVRLLGAVAPIRWAYEDVATPFEPYLGKEGCQACSTLGPDGGFDLTLKFDTQAVVAALGTTWNDGDCVVLNLGGVLKPEYGGVPIIGEDWVILKIK